VPTLRRAVTERDLARLLVNAMDGQELSAVRLADKAGISESTVLNWSHGRRLSSVAAYMRLLEACGLYVTVRLQGPAKARTEDGAGSG